MVAGYHCHAFDFARINGRFAWEILFSQLRPEINMQLDVGNCLSGGGDPIAMFKEFPGRSWSVHIKEYEDKTFDSDFYTEVFHLCETTCATKWYIVEMGGNDGIGFDVPRQAFAKLHSPRQSMKTRNITPCRRRPPGKQTPTNSTARAAQVSRRKFMLAGGAAAAFTIVPRHVLGGAGICAAQRKNHTGLHRLRHPGIARNGRRPRSSPKSKSSPFAIR